MLKTMYSDIRFLMHRCILLDILENFIIYFRKGGCRGVSVGPKEFQLPRDLRASQGVSEGTGAFQRVSEASQGVSGAS